MSADNFETPLFFWQLSAWQRSTKDGQRQKALCYNFNKGLHEILQSEYNKLRISMILKMHLWNIKTILYNSKWMIFETLNNESFSIKSRGRSEFNTFINCHAPKRWSMSSWKIESQATLIPCLGQRKSFITQRNWPLLPIMFHTIPKNERCRELVG